jgi:5'-deoxynucleotidase YfbR-like HD superfamily hydrolase
MEDYMTPTCTETVSGIIIDLTDPRPEDIKIEDIAWALSRMARYAGHTTGPLPYSVAQHSMMVSNYVQEALNPNEHLYDVFHKYLKKKSANWHNIFSTARPEFVQRMILHGLMHDFAEAYLIDMPTPVKRLPDFYEAYKRAESKLDSVIMLALGLNFTDPIEQAASSTIVHWADMYALLVEAYNLMPSRGLTWGLDFEQPVLPMLVSFRPPLPCMQAFEELLVHYEDCRLHK